MANKKRLGRPPVKKVKRAYKKRAPKIVLYAIDTKVLEPRRLSEAEYAEIRKKLKLVVPHLGVRAGNIPILTKHANTANRILKAEYPDKSFQISRIKDNTTYSRIFRRK